MKKILFYITLLVAFLFSEKSIAQKVEIAWVEIVSSKIVIHYDLDDSNPNHEYTISVFSSKDNYAAPLTRVSGDVGNEIKPGKNKTITWDVVQELGNYKGEIELELRGRSFTPFMKLTGFDVEKKYKRGKSYPLVWTSGNMSGQIDIELYSDQDRVSREANVANTGKYDLFIPGNVKPGKNYRLKFTNARNREEVIFSGTFRIVPKISNVLKIGLLAVVGGGVAAVAAGAGGGQDTTTPPGNNDLPGHPNTP